MKRMQAFILLVVGLLPALANAWCTMPPPANPGPVQPQLPNVAHTCWPEKWGLPFLTGKGYMERDIAAVPGATTEGGRCAAWWCQDAAGAWNVESHCALSSYTAGGIASGVAAALGAPDPVAALQAFADRYAATLTDPQQINSYNCLHWAIQQQAQATKPAAPPAPVLVVDAATSADGTRPAYPFANGVRGTASTARALSGQACKPEVAQAPSGVAGKVYAAFGPAFSPSMVALCRKQ